MSRILRTIGRVLAQEGAFDSATTDRVFTLAGPDFVAATLPVLLASVAASTPAAGWEESDVDDFLEAGLLRMWGPPSRREGLGLDILLTDSAFTEDVVKRATPVEIWPPEVCARPDPPAWRRLAWDRSSSWNM